MKPNYLSRVTAAALLTLHLAAASALAAGRDLDGDGIPNIVDPDIDNDGIPNALDRNVDGGVAKYGPFAGQYIGDHLDNDNPAEKDIDDDGLPDDSLAEMDIDGDGKRNDDALETDIDGDKRLDDSPAETDIDGDGRNDDDDREFDIDGDGLDDDDNAEMDLDGDSRDDDTDPDIDGDNRYNADAAELDTDGDGRADDSPAETNDDGDRLDDRMDSDDDNDGIEDNEDPDHHNEDDEQEVRITLTRQAAAPASSRVRVRVQQMASGKVSLKLDGTDLPAGAYAVSVDGSLIGKLEFTAHGNETEAEQEWETNANDADEINLTIPVIGRPITVSLGGVIYCSGTVPTPPPPSGVAPPPTPAKSNLLPTPSAPPGAKGKVDVEFKRNGLHSIDIEFEGLPAATYLLTVGNTPRAILTVGAGGQGHVTFETIPEMGENALPLNFPAAGLPLALIQDETILLTGTVPAAPPGVGDGFDGDGDLHTSGTLIIANFLRNPAAPAAAKGILAVQFGPAGAVEVEIEAENLPDGTYQLSVNGISRGSFTSSAGRGSIAFEVEMDAPGEFPLDFPISGLPVTISQGAVTLLSAVSPVAPGI